jgi:hypothetical protein
LPTKEIYLSEDTVTADSLQDEVPEANTPSIESINTLQEEFNASVSRFATNNPNVKPNVLMPFIIDMMLLFPWSWLVDNFKRTPEDFENALIQEVKTFSQSMKVRKELYEKMQAVEVDGPSSSEYTE